MNEKNEKELKSENEEDQLQSEENEDENFAIIPPNGGWGWVVVFSAFYCNVVLDGIQLTFGIFLKAIADEFHASHSEVALAGSLMFGIHLLMGPVCSGCSTVFGLRLVTIVGCLISCFGVGITYFATHNFFLYFSYGVIGGMGLGLVYMNTLMITSLYFTSYMPIAIGIVVCGTGVGTMIFAILGYKLLQMTSWRNSFLMQAALAGSMTFAAATFRPLKPVRVQISVEPRGSSSNSKPLSQLEKPSTSKRTSVFVKNFEASSKFSSRDIILNNIWNEVLEDKLLDEVSVTNNPVRCCKCCRSCALPQREKKTSKVLILMQVAEDARRQSYATRALEPSPDDERPLKNRKNTSVIELYKRIYIEERKPKRKTLTLLKQSISAMLDYHLLKSFSFLLFTICGAIQIATLLIVYIYEKDRCKDLGFSDEISIYFLVTLGGSNTLWRLFFGGLALFPKANRIISTIGIITGGIATICSGFDTSLYYQLGFCFLFGMAMASFAVFRIILLIDLVGLELVSNATGITLMFMGIFCIFSPPLLGWATETTKNYDIIFCVSGSLIVISGLVQLGIPKLRERELKKKERRTKVESDT